MTHTYVLPDGREVECNAPHEARSVWREISVDGTYEAAARGLGSGAVILDVGAHIGLAALHFADLVPGARILCFEPAPKTFSCLQVNLARHVPGGQAVPLAVGAAAGEHELTYFPDAPTMTTLYPDAEDDSRNLEAFLSNSPLPDGVKNAARRGMDVLERSTVRVTSVTEVVAEHGIQEIGLLKVDVERAENAVLNGISDDLWPRIRGAVIEVHDLDRRLGATLRRLEKHGFRTQSHQEPRFAGGSVHIVLATRP